MTLREALRQIRLFDKFSDDELEALLQLGEVETFSTDASIMIEGELTSGLFLILEGSVRIFKANRLSGETYDVGQLERGSFFGEMSLIDDNPRSATVRALEECRIFHLSKRQFLEFLARSSDVRLRFYEACSKDLVNRLRQLDDSYVVSQYQLWKTAFRKEAA